jgi:hypothetical protein
MYEMHKAELSWKFAHSARLNGLFSHLPGGLPFRFRSLAPLRNHVAVVLCNSLDGRRPAIRVPHCCTVKKKVTIG